MSNLTRDTLEAFDWKPQADAACFVHRLVESFCRQCSSAERLSRQLLEKTGTRLADWIDHLALPARENLESDLRALGFAPLDLESWVVWDHAGGLFPAIEIPEQPGWRLAIKVDSVADFLVGHHIDRQTPIEGSPLGALRRARIACEAERELWVVERHGYRGWEPPQTSCNGAELVLKHAESFRRRGRTFADERQGFDHALKLIRSAAGDLGVDRTCDLFFAAEREYWTSRNRAARVQAARQHALGLGWGNHDHHTYRSSREHFCRLIAVLEELGMSCRERFYAGAEAGWGAQVLQQPEASVVVFADLDLASNELCGDFAHQQLAPQQHFGTVGLWCKLHGEAFLQAGMHHLECRFDFDAVRGQLRQAAIRTMKPFTDLPFLKQAFTAGETWAVEPNRIEAALLTGAITGELARQFRRSGALGSHLEILQREQGYKGFNKAGVSEIIRATDPRGTDLLSSQETEP